MDTNGYYIFFEQMINDGERSMFLPDDDLTSNGNSSLSYSKYIQYNHCLFDFGFSRTNGTKRDFRNFRALAEYIESMKHEYSKQNIKAIYVKLLQILMQLMERNF